MPSTDKTNAWQINTYSSLSSCFGVAKTQFIPSTAITSVSKTVKPLFRAHRSSSIDDLVRFAEKNCNYYGKCNCSNGEPYKDKTNQCTFSRQRSLSNNDQSGFLDLPSLNPFSSEHVGCYEPLCTINNYSMFGQISSSYSHGNPHLANSLVIEYLAQVTTEQPFGRLDDNLTYSSSLCDSEGSASTKRQRKLGVVQKPCKVVVSCEDSLRREAKISSNIHCGDSHMLRDGCPKDGLKTGDEVRIKKLSAQAEVGALRSMLHEFEKNHVLRTYSGRSSTVGSPLAGRKRSSLVPAAINFRVSSNTGTSTLQLQSRAPSALSSSSSRESLQPSAEVQTSPPAPSHVRPHISRREHNIIAPLSF